MNIRPLEPSDREAWEPLWQGYLTFYRASIAPEVTQESWRRLHDPAEPMQGFAAIVEGQMAGIMHLIYHRSMWTVGPYCYLQDLFTAPIARRRGVGRALIERAASEARAKGAGRLYWLTHETNAEARLLYDAVGERSGFIQYRKAL